MLFLLLIGSIPIVRIREPGLYHLFSLYSLVEVNNNICFQRKGKYSCIEDLDWLTFAHSVMVLEKVSAGSKGQGILLLS